jgi:DnaJ-class molecular chaperone
MEHFLAAGIVPGKSSAEEIRKIYRRLALEHHPDKVGAIADDTFVRINQAYAKLTRVQQQYHNDDEVDNGGLSGLGEVLLKTLQTMMSEYARFQAEKQSQSQPPKPPAANSADNLDATVKLSISVALEDVYYAKVIKLKVQVKQFDHDAPRLTENVYVSLHSFKPQHTFVGQGDYYTSTDRGDIIVQVNVRPHPYINVDTVISPYDLYIEQDISLYEYYYREYFALPLFRDELIEIENLDLPRKKCYMCPRKGLPYTDATTQEDTRGNLYVHFHLSLPVDLAEDAKANLKPILREHFINCFHQTP